MANKKKFAGIIVSEEFKINSEKIISDFMMDISVETFEFPCTLTNVERAWIHEYAKVNYSTLKTKSYGNGSTRRIVLTKRNLDRTDLCRSALILRDDNLKLIEDYMKQLPYKDRNKVLSFKSRVRDSDSLECNLGLGYGIPHQPELPKYPEDLYQRTQLPIWAHREAIMQGIISNQVLIVCGETGSGKTTQLPQFILDYNALSNEKCRIVCTQPRRISAVAVADRVATERGENLGYTVGYHIRLESCVSPKTLLIYCTNGILLRTLMSGDSCLKSFTHIIVDEIHERDRFSDFLLICLRECLINYPNLRLILMSATMDTKLFQSYFNNAPVVYVPGRQYNVTEYYLEDILSLVSYESNDMFNLKVQEVKSSQEDNNSSQPLAAIEINTNEEIKEMSIDLRLEVEHTIYECVNDGSEDSFNQFLSLVLSENTNINHQHPETGYTALMAAAMHGNIEMCIQLLTYGAKLNLRSYIEHYTAINFAAHKNYMDCYYMLVDYQKRQTHHKDCSSSSKNDSLNEKSKATLKLYHQTISDENIDFDLLQSIIYYIYLNKEPGSILVFLSGYDDIITMKDRIIADTRIDPKKYQIITLHSMMQISEQNAVFKTITGKIKIILATNIAETSITIEDVKYVINTGKVKEKYYDALTGISGLKCNWISKAAAKQRAGRAGRTQIGECFHMFTKTRFTSMSDYATPEILRTPLNELCLQTKMLAPSHIKIANFLSRALEKPPELSILNAVKHLQEINAIDNDENLTLLGRHLVDLPIEPRLAKMLIYASIFKCLDPILTIAAFESQRDPFLLPPNSQQKINALKKRKKFSCGTFSDHMILLRVFQEWQEARVQRCERVFCNENFVSSATMDTIILIRSQLLAQLRAIGFIRTKPPGDVRGVNENSQNWALMKAILTIGLFPNVAYINQSSLQIQNKVAKKIYLHNSSALRQNESLHDNENINEKILKFVPSNWLIFDEISRFNNSFRICSVTSVSPLTVALFADHSTTLPVHSDDDIDSIDDDVDTVTNTIIINEWIAFECNKVVLDFITTLRHRLNNLAMKKIANPFKRYSDDNEFLIKLTAKILLNEDNELKFVQPEGIGNRPKFVTSGCEINRPFRNRDNVQYKNPYFYANNEDVVKYLKFDNLNVQNYNKFNNSTQNTCFNFEELTKSLEKTINENAVQSGETSNFVTPGTSNQAHQFEHSYTQNSYQLGPFLCAGSSYAYDYENISNPKITIPEETATSSLFQHPYSPTLQNHHTPNQNHHQQQRQEQVIPWQFQVCNPSAYFIIKASSLKSIDVSVCKKTWVFPPHIDRKIAKSFQLVKTVVLIFTVPKTKCFNGLAKINNIQYSDLNVLYNITYNLEWVMRADIPYEKLENFNSGTIYEDEEISQELGKKILHLFINVSPPKPGIHEPTYIPQGGRDITKKIQF